MLNQYSIDEGVEKGFNSVKEEFPNAKHIPFIGSSLFTEASAEAKKSMAISLYLEYESALNAMLGKPFSKFIEQF